MYKVVKSFIDLNDGRKYNVGDKYPADGVKVSDARLKKLSSDANRQKTPLIKEEAQSLNSTITPAQPSTVGQEAPVKQKSRSVTKKTTTKKN